ncbi:MAG: GDP-mannose-dependent monoacylated alpha-(1-6)-phosphatidylinositol monomannoside mannosyltransferase [Acidimicrobiia bacterium]|nr:MAG: GDP-mannose-dependent monoacylated alpha-(1-6)-phosphatidylinositol monomannoside mannosyltransferase [Acidimicrobiia bacterium]
MRLLVVTNDFPPKRGGIQMYLKNLLNAFDGESHVVAPHDPIAENAEQGVTRGEKTFMLPGRATRSLVLEACESFQPDAILFGAPHPLPQLGPWLRTTTGLPFGILSHGAEVTIPGSLPGARQLLGRTLAGADVRFAVSRFTARKVAAISGRPTEFLGAGVEIETFSPPDIAPNREVPVVGCVSRFVPRKGQDRLLRAVAELDREVEVLLVGTGREESKLRKLADELDINVRFAVDVEWTELPGLYRSMDIFCMPCSSRWAGREVEGLGLVFLEAAASGLPVLAGDSGGSPETVRPGETGFVVSSISDIVEGLSMLLDDPVRARGMGEAGRALVESEFTWARVVERLNTGFEPLVR